MKCPKCGSMNVVRTTSTFPALYQCEDCGFVFNKNENPWTDE
jgi:predicted RNA-binding Zn-ribbon protein involved in translation (DUF1610 family)